MILPGRATGSAYFSPLSGRRAPAGARLARAASGLSEAGKRFETPVVPLEPFPQVRRRLLVGRLEIDDGIALDHAQPRFPVRFEPDDLHDGSSSPYPCNGRT